MSISERIATGDLREHLPWLRGRPEIEALLRRPCQRLEYDLAKLRALPAGTLGRAFAAMMIERGLDPQDLAKTVGDESTFGRFRAHLESTHDVWHIVTGFSTETDGEIGLQAFYVAQLGSPFSLTLLSAGLLNVAIVQRRPGWVLMEQLTRGFTMGRQARPLTGIDWSLHWTKPLAELRRELGIVIDKADDTWSTAA